MLSGGYKQEPKKAWVIAGVVAFVVICGVIFGGIFGIKTYRRKKSARKIT